MLYDYLIFKNFNFIKGTLKLAKNKYKLPPTLSLVLPVNKVHEMFRPAQYSKMCKKYFTFSHQIHNIKHLKVGNNNTLYQSFLRRHLPIYIAWTYFKTIMGFAEIF